LGEHDEAAAKLLRAIQEFGHFIEVNQHAIPNYGDRYRHGDTISTSFTESAVKQVVSKRMVKLPQNELEQAWSAPDPEGSVLIPGPQHSRHGADGQGDRPWRAGRNRNVFSIDVFRDRKLAV
jgi:hypothetical protein